jgi:hypothetical protein
MSTDFSLTSQSRGRILFICGSMNQTTQMHQIAQELPEYDHYFTPYYSDGLLGRFQKWGWLEFTILGNKIANRALNYFKQNDLNIDLHGEHGPYDLVFTCADLLVPKNVRRSPIILVQEGMTDPEHWVYKLAHTFRFLPRWIASTSMMGLSGRYARFCVASEAYKDLFIRKGAPAEKLVVTGIPNFDDCAKHRINNFPHKDYLLVTTSDMRETFMPENRKKFIEKAVRLAAGRQMIFKLHPNEDWERARREIEQHAPGALIYTDGNTDQMIANCSAFLTHYSSTVYVALALRKEVHCDLDVEELRALMPLQNRTGAKNIAVVARAVIEEALERVQVRRLTRRYVRPRLSISH